MIDAPGVSERAIYDLSTRPSTFDFGAYALLCKTFGAKHINFKYDGKIASHKYSEEIAWKRFANILIPLAKLAGLTWEVTNSSEGMDLIPGAYHAGYVNMMYEQEGKFEKFQPTYKLKKEGHVSITLRESFKDEWRNSNREAWKRFAQDLKDKGEEVIIVRECEQHPLDLEWRMAVYASAKQNLSVSCGPMALCYFSDSPYTVLNMAPTQAMERFMSLGAFPPGSQFHFKNKNQKIFWIPDTYENIHKAWEEMCSESS